MTGSVPTNIFISIDMEGIAGITTLRQCTRGQDDYEWARELMTEEANAAIAGAFEASADTVVVSDSHGDMGNLLPHRLDPRAELVQGTPKTPWSMMTGIDDTFAGAIFVGYHAGAGTSNAVLDHTYTGSIMDVRVNGETWNETHLNAALAGTFGVPVALVAGDRACCEQAHLVPGVTTVSVKDGFGNRVGRTISPERARTLIREGVRSAVEGVHHLQPWIVEGPYVLEIDHANTALADMCEQMPFTQRPAPRTTRFEADDLREIFRGLLTWMNLGARVAASARIE